MQGLQRLRGTETGRQSGIVSRVAKSCEVQRQVWLLGLQRLQGTDTYRKTGMVARFPKFSRYRDGQTGMVASVAKVARYRDKYTDRYGSKGCNCCQVQRHIDRQVWLQGLQRFRGTECGYRFISVSFISGLFRVSCDIMSHA